MGLYLQRKPSLTKADGAHFYKGNPSPDESFKFQRILALWCLKNIEQLIFWWGADMTWVQKVRTPCLPIGSFIDVQLRMCQEWSLSDSSLLEANREKHLFTQPHGLKLRTNGYEWLQNHNSSIVKLSAKNVQKTLHENVSTIFAVPSSRTSATGLSGTFWNILHTFWNILEHSTYLHTFWTDGQTDRHTLGLVELLKIFYIKEATQAEAAAAPAVGLQPPSTGDPTPMTKMMVVTMMSSLMHRWGKSIRNRFRRSSDAQCPQYTSFSTSLSGSSPGVPLPHPTIRRKSSMSLYNVEDGMSWDVRKEFIYGMSCRGRGKYRRPQKHQFG